MLDIIEIAIEKGEETGLNKGEVSGIQRKFSVLSR